MSQLEELKLFVAGRLRTATSEILDVIDKTIEAYEQEVSRLKEENKRHSSLLEIILKKKLPKKQGCHVANTTNTEVAAKLATDCSIAPAVKEENSPSGSSALDSGVNSKTQTSTVSATVGKQTVFISKECLLRFSTMENCFFCFKQVPASKHHLMKRHYDIAVHFIQDNIEKFVIPCMCSDKVQERSHWHCPCCEKVLNRRCIFKVHLSKQHCYTVLQTKYQVSGSHCLPYTVTFEEESSGLEDSEEDEEELSSLEQQQEMPSPLLQMKEKAAGQLLNVVDAQHSGSSQPQQHCLYLKQDHGRGIRLNTRIQDGREVIVVKSRQNNGFGKVLDSAGKMLHPNETGVVTKGTSCSNTKESIPTQSASSSSVDLGPPSKKHAKNQLDLNLSAVKTESSASQNRVGSYYCKACGEIFHYFHKLKTHVRKHAGDKICICGVCGERLMRSESLHEHLQNHSAKNVCGMCGKQFTSQSRLQQHKTFHKSKIKYKIYNMITPGCTEAFQKSKI